MIRSISSAAYGNAGLAYVPVTTISLEGGSSKVRVCIADYLAAKPGETYALYFTHGGSVGLDLTEAPGSFDVKWISVSEGVTTRTTSAKVYAQTKDSIEGGGVVTLSAPYKGGWVAALLKK